MGANSGGSGREKPLEWTGDDPYALRRAAIREDIARRIRPICGHYSDEEFNALLHKMVERQVAFEMRGFFFRGGKPRE